MKHISLALAFLISSNTLLLANEPKEIFSVAQRNEVIRLVDNYCGDTWCEGDYNFKFTDFSCNKASKSCDLSFYFIKTNEQSVQTFSALQVCHFSNITKFTQIRESKFELNETFLEELTDCIGIHQYEIRF